MHRLRIASYFVCAALIGVACKSQVPPQTSRVLEGGATTEDADSSLVMYAPGPDVAQRPATRADFQAAFPELFRAGGEGLTVVTTPDGEAILYGPDGFGNYPLVSLEGDRRFLWQTLTFGDAADGSLRLQSARLAFKTPLEADDDDLAQTTPYILQPLGQGDESLIPVPLKDHSFLPSGVLMRAGNRYVDRSGRTLFHYDQLSADVWRLGGDFYNGMACPGSILWRRGERYYFATRQFGALELSEWRRDGGSLVLTADKVDAQVPAEVQAAVESCPFNRPEDTQRRIAKLEFNPEAPVRETKAGKVPEPFVWGTTYPTGAVVLYDNAYWQILESVPENDYYTFLNMSRTTLADQGETHGRVYMLSRDDEGVTELFEYEATPAYMARMAAQVHSISEERLGARTEVAAYMEWSRKKLQTAEAKANAVGAGWHEWYKPVIQTVSNAAMDALLNPKVSQATVGVFGVPFTGNSIKRAVTGANVSLGKRISATIAVVLIESLADASRAVVPKLAGGDVAGAGDVVSNTTKQTGIVYLLRAVAGASPTKRDDVILYFGSGLAMRNRKLNIEKALGYENQNDTANLIAGGFTAAAEVMAVNAGWKAGKVRAIGKGGVLVSEVIAGRGYPGVIVGGLVEVGTDLLVVHPAIRPFANTLAGQINALAQLGDAKVSADMVGRRLDRLRERRLEQVKKVNAIIFLLKQYPRFFDRLEVKAKSLVLTTAADPFAKIREHDRQYFPDLP